MSQRPDLIPLPNNIRAVRDVCGESACRLTALLRLLEEHNCDVDGASVAGTGGFDLSLIREELQRIRERLQEAAS